MIWIDMEMPPSCHQCPLYYLGYGEDEVYVDKCSLSSEIIEDSSSRADFCPLKEG